MICQATEESPVRDANGEFAFVSEERIEQLSEFFKLLSDATRLRIIQLLRQNGELHVQALCERLGFSQPAVSHHLALLKGGTLIDLRRDGKHNYYSVQEDQVQRLANVAYSSMFDGYADEADEFEPIVGETPLPFAQPSQPNVASLVVAAGE